MHLRKLTYIMNYFRLELLDPLPHIQVMATNKHISSGSNDKLNVLWDTST